MAKKFAHRRYYLQTQLLGGSTLSSIGHESWHPWDCISTTIFFVKTKSNGKEVCTPKMLSPNPIVWRVHFIINWSRILTSLGLHINYRIFCEDTGTWATYPLTLLQHPSPSSLDIWCNLLACLACLMKGQKPLNSTRLPEDCLFTKLHWASRGLSLPQLH